MHLLSPAKINLYLSIGPPDSTGYHPLVSEFQAIGLADDIWLEVSANGTDSLTSNWNDLPTPNTITRTLGRLRELIDVPPLTIHLEKRIPTEAGLGGGSSNAAAVLRGVLHLLQTTLPWEQDFTVAASVGADVPFFLVGGRALVEGYGERVTPLPDQPQRCLLVVKPAIAGPTKALFAALDAARPVAVWHQHSEGNDFELVMPPECRAALVALKEAGADSPHLSGSGTAVFGFFPNPEKAQEAMESLTAHGTCWVTHTLSRAESLSIN